MTTAPKIDTTAPERVWIGPSIHGWDWPAVSSADDPRATEYERRDLADARAAAMWQAAIGALLDEVGGLPISEIAADEVIYAAKLLQPPADTQAALDRLIAERVREVGEAEREACAKVADEYASENFRMATDSVLLDRMQGFSDTEERQIEGSGYSASGITARNIAAAIRSRGSKEGRS